MLAVLVLHGVEQLLFGIDELYEMKAAVATYQSWFANPDYGTVVLVFLVVIVVQSITLAGLSGGRWILLPAGFFGLAGVGEIHHVVKTFAHGAYFPGAVSAVAFATVGALLFGAVIRELRRGSAPVHVHARPVEA
jgi:hypothetical protein